MATREITRWHITRFPASATHGPYAYVQLHGKEYHGMLRTRYSLVSESYRIPLEPDAQDNHKANQALVRKAMEISGNKWTGRIP